MKKIIITGRRPAATELNMAPLIDMIFILLIFFLVTTSFVNEAGLERKKPQLSAKQTSTEKRTNVTLGVMADNSIWDQEEGRSIDIKSVRAYIENFLIEAPKGTVVVAADKDSQIGTVVKVMDYCRLAGVIELSVAPMTRGENR
jgi:biopolymer transport protein ExbD